MTSSVPFFATFVLCFVFIFESYEKPSSCSDSFYDTVCKHPSNERQSPTKALFSTLVEKNEKIMTVDVVRNMPRYKECVALVNTIKRRDVSLRKAYANAFVSASRFYGYTAHPRTEMTSSSFRNDSRWTEIMTWFGGGGGGSGSSFSIPPLFERFFRLYPKNRPFGWSVGEKRFDSDETCIRVDVDHEWFSRTRRTWSRASRDIPSTLRSRMSQAMKRVLDAYDATEWDVSIDAIYQEETTFIRYDSFETSFGPLFRERLSLFYRIDTDDISSRKKLNDACVVIPGLSKRGGAKDFFDVILSSMVRDVFAWMIFYSSPPHRSYSLPVETNREKEDEGNDVRFFCSDAIRRIDTMRTNDLFLSHLEKNSPETIGRGVESLVNKIRSMSRDIVTERYDPLATTLGDRAQKKFDAMRVRVLEFPSRSVATRYENVRSLLPLACDTVATDDDGDDAQSKTNDGKWLEWVKCMWTHDRIAFDSKRLIDGLGTTKRSDLFPTERYMDVYAHTDTSIVNAWYDPTRNEITVPAGIVGKGVYEMTPYPDAKTLSIDASRLGMIIGHEIGHAFDPNGIVWDENGIYTSKNNDDDDDVRRKENGVVEKKRTTSSSSHLFDEGSRRAIACLIRDYGHWCDDKDDYAEKTIGEDTADQFGIRVAYRMFKDSVRTNLGRNATNEEKRLFFVDYAGLWCKPSFDERESNVVDDIRRSSFMMSKTSLSRYGCDGKKVMDEHAVPKHRVDKTLRHFPTFGRVFD